MEYPLKYQKEILRLEKFFPHNVREITEELSFAFSIFFLSFSVLFTVPSFSAFTVLWPVAQGLFLVSFSVLLVSIMLEVYFQSLHARLRRGGVSLAVSLITEGMKKKKDSVASLFYFSGSKNIKKRLGIAEKQLTHFLSQKKPQLIYPHIDHSLDSFGHHVYLEDLEFQDFLESVMVEKDEFVEVLKLAEKNMYSQFQTRVFLSPLFSSERQPRYTFEDMVRIDIDDFEYMYNIHFTEKAIRDVVSYFTSERINFIDSYSRKELISELIENTLRNHQKLSHAPRTILPSDTRSFLILYKAKKI